MQHVFLINVFYVNLICIGFYHVTYYYRKKNGFCYFATSTVSNSILAYQSTGLSEESIKQSGSSNDI